MILRLTDGTTTVNLSNGTDDIWMKKGAGYVPRSPRLGVTAYESLLRDGGNVVNVKRFDVDESVGVYFNPLGDTFSDAQTAIQAVEDLLTLANYRATTGRGAQVYVEYAPEDGGTAWRSPVYDGRLTLAAGTDSMHKAGFSEGLISWRRAFYWEGARAELAIENGSVGSPQTGGVTVDNTTDSGRWNYVDIAGTDIDGVIPTPIEIRMQNTYNVAARTDDVYLAANVFSEPTTLDHILEGEDADYIAGGAAATVDAGSSDGEYQVATWAGDSYTRVFSWDLSASYLAKTKGYFYRLLARVLSVSSDTRMKIRITYASVTTVAESPSVAVTDTSVMDIGAIALPPWLGGETGLLAIRLDLFCQRTGGGSISLDFVQVTALDSYRVLEPVGFGVPYLYTLVDDGIEGLVYVDLSGNKAGYYGKRGGPLMIWPGRDVRLYLFCDENTGEPDVDRTHSVRVYYRPRRLTV